MLATCCGIKGIKHFGTRCCRKIIDFGMATVTALLNATLLMIIFLY